MGLFISHLLAQIVLLSPILPLEQRWEAKPKGGLLGIGHDDPMIPFMIQGANDLYLETFRRGVL